MNEQISNRQTINDNIMKLNKYPGKPKETIKRVFADANEKFGMQ
jgi:hypothetical protein